MSHAEHEATYGEDHKGERMGLEEPNVVCAPTTRRRQYLDTHAHSHLRLLYEFKKNEWKKYLKYPGIVRYDVLH